MRPLVRLKKRVVLYFTFLIIKLFDTSRYVGFSHRQLPKMESLQKRRCEITFSANRNDDQVPPRVGGGVPACATPMSGQHFHVLEIYTKGARR